MTPLFPKAWRHKSDELPGDVYSRNVQELWRRYKTLVEAATLWQCFAEIDPAVFERLPNLINACGGHAREMFILDAVALFDQNPRSVSLVSALAAFEGAVSAGLLPNSTNDNKPSKTLQQVISYQQAGPYLRDIRKARNKAIGHSDGDALRGDTQLFLGTGPQHECFMSDAATAVLAAGECFGMQVGLEREYPDPFLSQEVRSLAEATSSLPPADGWPTSA